MLAVFFVALTAQPIRADRLTYQEGPLEVIGRYLGFLDGVLTLAGTDIKFIVEDAAVAGRLFDLTPGKDNLVLTGRFTARRTFKVKTLKKAPNDVVLLRRRIADLKDDPAEVARIAADALDESRTYDDEELGAVAREVLRKAYEQQLAATDPKDVERRLELVKKAARHLEDSVWAIRKTTAILKDRPGWKPAEEFLRSLGCFKWRGKWLEEKDFLKAQGYVYSKGRWIAPEELRLRRIIPRLKALRANHVILRGHTDEYYELKVREGKTLRGMTRKEVAGASGFADDVRRIRNGDATYELWVYGSTTIFFINGIVAIISGDTEREFSTPLLPREP